MKIILADNQPRVRFALRALLAQQQHVEIVGEARDIDMLQSLIDTAVPDLVILDWDLPGLADFGSITALRANNPNLYIVVLSGHNDVRQNALDAGTNQFVSKTDPPEKLLAALENTDFQ